ESADHCALDHEVHLSQRRRRSLPLEHLEIVTVIRPALLRITFLERLGDFVSNRTSPRPVRVLPCQTVVFSWRANDSLRVLVHLGIIVLFLGILVLCLDETTTNLNGIQFVGADTPI